MRASDSGARAFSTPGAAVIIFLALMIALSTFYAVADNTSERVGEAISDERQQQADLLGTRVDLVDVTYENGETTLRVENTGTTTLSVDGTDVFVNGGYYHERDFRDPAVDGATGTDVWSQGGTLRFGLPTPQPRRVQVTVGNGIAAFTRARTLIDGAELVIAQGDDLASVDNGSGVTGTYGVTNAVVTGPMVENVHGTGVDVIPYVDSGGAVETVDESGTVRTLASDADATASRLFVGTWQGSDVSVFYVDATSENVERVTADGTTTAVASVSAEAVSGTADLDGDGADELAFGDTSRTLRYVDDDGTVSDTGAGYGSNVSIGLGEPADFDGDGVARVPIVDGGNDVALAADDGAVTRLTGTGPAAKAPLGTFDWDGDGTPEIVFVRADGTLAYVDDVTGENAVETITEGGSTVTADEDTGAA